MDSLASSHTVHSLVARLLLLMFVLCHHSILAVTESDSKHVQDMDSFELSTMPSKESLARIRIRGAQLGEKESLGLRKRRGSESAAQPDGLLPAVAPPRIERSRTLLGDISPPGMWPTTDGQDPAPVAQEEFRRRSLLAGSLAPPPLEPWFVGIHSTRDGEDAFLRGALVADTTYPLVRWPVIIGKVKQVKTVLEKASLAFKVLRTETFGASTVISKDGLPPVDHGEWRNILARVMIPDAGNSSDAVGHEMRSGSEHSEDSEGSEKPTRGELNLRRRSLLQADISPPGMWTDPDDDETHFPDSGLLRRRSLLQLGAISRLGVWQVSDDADSFKRRVLLADISPPGMWADNDDQDQYMEFPNVV